MNKEKYYKFDKRLYETLNFNSPRCGKTYYEINKLQQENEKLKERIEYLERSNDRREDTILEQRQEISNLEDNWNILNEYLEKRYKDVTSVIGSYGSNTDMLYGKKEMLKEILQQIQKYKRR